MTVNPVAITGAGIAGLTCALSLARHGIESDIIERAHHLMEVGAGIQISPNASRVLGAIGILPALEAVWNEPKAVHLVDGSSLSGMITIPVGPEARRRWGSPYGVLYRSTLQQALLEAVMANPLCRLHTGHAMEHVTRVTAGAVTGHEHDVVVGADGVWSRTRESVPQGPRPSFSGNVAWRFTVSPDNLPDFLDLNAVTALTGTSAHVVAYPLRETGGFNIVAIASGADPGETWKAESGKQQISILRRHFSSWNPSVMSWLEKIDDMNFWPLWSVADGNWHNGRDTVLTGDAAHAMMPYSAQGAAMAIEDGFELAGVLAGSGSIAEKLAKFEALRKPRITSVRKRGSLNGMVYHASGLTRVARNIMFAVRPASAFVSGLDWLYGYRATDRQGTIE